MLASRINSLLPDLSNGIPERCDIKSGKCRESVQVSALLPPHHSASLTAMVGGGAILRAR